MPELKLALTGCALCLSVVALPALAASSTASSASDSASTSVGSLSDSVTGSSQGSSKATGVAQGDYKIIEVAVAANRPGTLRMKLQAVADRGADREFYLDLPLATVEGNRLAAGQTVTASNRPYGVEFAHGSPRRAFFLLLADDWHRELRSNAVAL
jgi:hypothetical protein